MRDQQDGLAGLVVDALQFEIHALARHGVERAERLVHQHDLRIVHQGPADGGALLHAAGELPGIFVLEILRARPWRGACGHGPDGSPGRGWRTSTGIMMLRRTVRQGSSTGRLEDDADIVRRLARHGVAADAGFRRRSAE